MIRASLSTLRLALVAALMAADHLAPGERRLRELYAGGGPVWNSYPRWGRKPTGAAKAKRAALRLRNVRARASKR